MDRPHFKVANWEEYQHYKDRDPVWIKLHRSLVTSEMWVSCDDASRSLAIACMVIAAENNGCVPANPAFIKRRCFLNSDPDFKPLVDTGFLIDASGLLAGCYQDARPEERRGEKRREETEKNTSLNPPTGGIADETHDDLQPDQHNPPTEPTRNQTEPYRWNEFAAIYPDFRIRPDTRGKKAWRKLVKGEGRDRIVEEILAGTKRWVESEQWRQGIVPNVGKYVEGEMWRSVPPAPRGSPGRDGRLIRHNKAVVDDYKRDLGLEVGT